MYQAKDKQYAIIAVLYYFVMMLSYAIMGSLYQRGMGYYSIIHWLLMIGVVLIVTIKDKSVRELGFTKEKLKPNLLISGAIVVVSIGAAFLYTDKSVNTIAEETLYLLFFIALPEEIIFRGFMQNYLFGVNVNRKIVYIIGAVMFSLMHLPFQMYAKDMVSWSYIVAARPQLIYTFLFHLVMCFITYKRKDILIPTALHFANNFL